MQITNLQQLDTSSWIDPRAFIVYSTQNVDVDVIRDLRAKFPRLEIFGASSYHGIIAPSGYERGSLGLVVEASDALETCPILVEFDCEARASKDVRERVSAAIRSRCDCSKSPTYVVMHAMQGYEERVIEGIHDVFDDRVQVFGATAANDKFLSKPFVFLNEKTSTCGVLLAVVYGDRLVCAIHQAGYLPTQKHGIVTASNLRTIERIDDRPAAAVYNEWTDSIFDIEIARGGDLPRSAGLYTIGSMVRSNDEMPDEDLIWLAHPYRIDAENQSIEFYSEIPVGSHIYLMRSSADYLVDQAGRMVSRILRHIDPSTIRTAFVMYCAGCASIIAEKMNKVCQNIRHSLGDIPFIGMSSFGEQGRVEASAPDTHGNMMIAILLIKR